MTRVLIGGSAESTSAIQAVQNRLAAVGVAAASVSLASGGAETDFVGALGAGTFEVAVLVVCSSQIRVPAGEDHAVLSSEIASALRAAVGEGCSVLHVVLVGSTLVPLDLPSGVSGRVRVLRWPSGVPSEADEVAAQLGLEVHRAPESFVPVLHNTPPATYVSFIPRKRLEAVENSLATDIPVTIILGQGGVGKSSMAREIAYRTVLKRNNLGFGTVVWVSDKADSGSTTLGRLLDQLAETVGFLGLRSMPPDLRSARARQYAQQHACLFVVDNYETVTDSALAQWLASVPPPSRVLLTSREDCAGFAGVQRIVRLTGFARDSAGEFVQQVMEKLDLGSHRISQRLIDELCSATAGNAKAIEAALGLIYAAGHSKGEVLGTLCAGDDELFTDLFQRCWDALDSDSRLALLAMSLLPFGATVGLLTMVAGRDSRSVRASLDRARRLSLADQLIVGDPRSEEDIVLLSCNPLVLAFVRSKHTEMDEQLAPLKDRCVSGLRAIAAAAGFCPGEIHRLEALDHPMILANIEAVVAWCAEEGRDADVVALTRDIRYYYYVRGVWSPDPNPHLVRAEAARRMGDPAQEFDALLYYCNIAAKQENLAAIRAQWPHIEALSAQLCGDPVRMLQFAHVQALCHLASAEHAQAIAIWEKSLSSCLLGAEDESANRRWLAVARLRSGDLEGARAEFVAAIEMDSFHGFRRAVVASRLHLVRIDLTEGHAEAADHSLKTLADLVSDTNDRLYEAEWNELSGRVHQARGETECAKRFFERASEQYDRLGLDTRSRELLAGP